jgi:hypothetical protein
LSVWNGGLVSLHAPNWREFAIARRQPHHSAGAAFAGIARGAKLPEDIPARCLLVTYSRFAADSPLPGDLYRPQWLEAPPLGRAAASCAGLRRLRGTECRGYLWLWLRCLWDGLLSSPGPSHHCGGCEALHVFGRRKVLCIGPRTPDPLCRPGDEQERSHS